MAIGARGVVFTLMAIVIASVIVVSASVLMDSGKQFDASPQHIRVRVVDGFVDSFESYVASALRVSVYNGLNNLSSLIANQPPTQLDTYFLDNDDLEKNLVKCMFHKDDPIILNGSNDRSCNNNRTLDVILQEFSDDARDYLNINVSFSIDESSLNLWEEYPFMAVANLTLNYTISDDEASWNVTNKNIEVDVPLYGLNDPVTGRFASINYLASPRAFIESAYPEGGGQLTAAIAEGTFSKSAAAPSILQRFIGDFSNKTCGTNSHCGVVSFIDEANVDWGWWSGASYNYSHLDYDLFNTSSGALPPPIPCAELRKNITEDGAEFVSYAGILDVLAVVSEPLCP